MTKILIVDDHDSVRRALRDWLAINLPGCRFYEAITGEQAIALCQTEKPAIVLMDYGLATINGIEATRRIKDLSPEIQVVMISIHEDQCYQIAAAEAGAHRYVPKSRMQKTQVPILNDLVRAKRSPKPARVN